MGTRIEVMTKGSIDPNARGLISKQPIRVYNIDDKGNNKLIPEEISQIENLLADPVVDMVATNRCVLLNTDEKVRLPIFIEMSPKPGVNDPEGKEAKKAIEAMLGRKIGDVSFAQQYLWNGELNSDEYAGLKKQLSNPLIFDFIRVDPGIGFHFPYIDLPEVKAFEYINVNITDEKLMTLSDNRYLALNLEEMKTIQDLFKDPEFIEKRRKKGLEAKPTDAELEGIAQGWSEHCIHKKLNAIWGYTTEDPNDESGLPAVTDSVFKSIIKQATLEIGQHIDWLVSIFEDNSGVIKLNDEWNVSHKVETHNHPTGIYAFGGANTGTGGVIRDNKSTGTGMSLDSSQWSFRVPHPESYKDLPIEIQTPARTLEGMVDGVEDYGNKMGIPTQCGTVMVHDGWLKPACYVGGVATVEAEINGKLTHVKDVRPGYFILSLGGKVGKDGIHGATGSSTDLAAGAEERQDVNQSVQIGAPIVEKGVFEVMNILQRKGLVTATQDCGAGGWNSAVGELAALLNELEDKRYEVKKTFKEQGITEKSPYAGKLKAAAPIIGLDKLASPFTDQLKLEIGSGEIFSMDTNGHGGVDMDLTHAPEKYRGLVTWEKLISEAQEREVLVVKPENVDKVLEICEHNNVDVTILGQFNDTGYYHVLDQNISVVYLPIEFLHQGLPQMEIKAHYKPCKNKEPNIPELEDLTETALKLISQPNLQSYNWIKTRFDHEVQGGSLIKPLVGVGKVESDAIAYRPVLEEKEVIIETLGSNPWQGDIDAYHMGRNNVVEAIGKIIATGGNLDKITFNGNTTCPKPEKDPEVAAKVIRMLKGAADAEIAFGTPTISGKDSTSMQRDYTSTKTGEKITVKAKPELLMSALAVIPDDSTLTTCDFKLPGDLVYVIGDTRDELGASEFYLMNQETGRNVPKSDLEQIKTRYIALSQAIKQELIHSAQYVAKGGLFKALANSSIGGDLGIAVNIDYLDEGLGRADKLLFSETTGRFVVTVHPSKKQEFEQAMTDVYIKEVGSVREDNEVYIRYNKKNIVYTNVNTIKEKNKGEIRF